LVGHWCVGLGRNLEVLGHLGGDQIFVQVRRGSIYTNYSTAVCSWVLEPVKINRRTIFEFEQATEATVENGFINDYAFADRMGVSIRIRLFRGDDDLDFDATLGCIAVVLKLKCVIVMGLDIV